MRRWMRTIRRFEGVVRPRAFTAFFTVALLAVVGSGNCRGSHIRSHRLHATTIHAQASQTVAWNQFLNGGPALWAVVKPPRFPSHISLAKQNGVLVDTPFVEYLNWRRNLNIARFDAYHRSIGPALAQLGIPKANSIATSGLQSLTGPNSLTNPVLQNSVPEPSSLAVAIAILGLSFGLRLRQAKQV